MKIARFSHAESISYGIVDEDHLVVLKGDPLFNGYEPTGERVAVADAKLLAPIIPRSKVVGVGRNYREHAIEMGSEAPHTPLLFLKPNTAIIGPGDAITLPAESNQVEYEGELAVVIGRVTRRVAAEDALDRVFGYTIANDVTARDLAKTDGQWARAKGFDTFCPLGPVIETELDVANSAISTRVNGELRQQASFADMVHDVAALVEFASNVFTLLPGDIILTGTPAGVGPIVSGDKIAVGVTGIGELVNQVSG